MRSDLKNDTDQYIFTPLTNEHSIVESNRPFTETANPSQERDTQMSKILAAVIAVSVVTAAAAPSYAFDFRSIQSTASEK